MGQKLTVIAWLWARTVKSPNPAFADVDVPLASTFMLSTKAGKEAYVEPVIEDGGYRFTVKVGKPKDAEAAKNGTKLARGANFRCVMSGDADSGRLHQGRRQGRAHGRTADGDRRGRGRVGGSIFRPTVEHESIAAWPSQLGHPTEDCLTIPIPAHFCVLYGLDEFGDLFTTRQLVALTTFTDSGATKRVSG